MVGLVKGWVGMGKGEEVWVGKEDEEMVDVVVKGDVERAEMEGMGLGKEVGLLAQRYDNDVGVTCFVHEKCV